MMGIASRPEHEQIVIARKRSSRLRGERRGQVPHVIGVVAAQRSGKRARRDHLGDDVEFGKRNAHATCSRDEDRIELCAADQSASSAEAGCDHPSGAGAHMLEQSGRLPVPQQPDSSTLGQ